MNLLIRFANRSPFRPIKRPFMNLAENIRKYRVKKGWSQNKLAAHADISQQGVQQIEAGLRLTPNWVTVCKLADALGVSLDELRFGKKKDKKR